MSCCRCDDDRSPVEREADRIQQSVLGLLLLAHPGQRSIEEVIREESDPLDDAMARDRVENAIRDLVGAGLLHSNGQFVFATRAAVRADELKF
jgi:hypothetical protein